MAKIASLPRISRETLVDAPEGEWFDQVLEVQAQQTDSYNSAFAGNISFEDNLTSKMIEGTFEHGKATTVKNTLPSKRLPLGVWAIRSSGLAVMAANVTPIDKEQMSIVVNFARVLSVSGSDVYAPPAAGYSAKVRLVVFGG